MATGIMHTRLPQAWSLRVARSTSDDPSRSPAACAALIRQRRLSLMAQVVAVPASTCHRRSARPRPYGFTELGSGGCPARPRVQCEVRSYVVHVARRRSAGSARRHRPVMSCRQLASMRRQTVASLTISWFHNDGPHRHVCSDGKVKSSSFADRNKKRRGPHCKLCAPNCVSAMELGRDD